MMCGVKRAKISGIIHTHKKVNQFVQENVHTITSLPFKRYYSNKHFSEFYPQDGGENQVV